MSVELLNTNLCSRWPHRLAVALVCATFPLIWVGGLVTTYKAGMAVPDWPNTYGYNLFLYPWQTWIYGPWQLFVEHGHRLFASAVGLLTIAFFVAVWRKDDRAWMRRLAGAAVAAVIFQGLLGGLRVIEDKVLLAEVHGCFGPAFFALCVALAACTSRWWRTASLQPNNAAARLQSHHAAARLQRLSIFTTALVYLQVILGSQLRHLPVAAEPGQFRAAVVFHLVVAALVALHVALLVAAVFRSYRDQPLLVRPAVGLAALIVLQLLLGGGTWITKYGWPSWLSRYDWTAGYTIVAEGRVQVLTATAHVAIGSLILGTSLALALRASRLLVASPRVRTVAVGRPLAMGVTL